MSYVHAMLACSEVRMIVRRNVIVDGNHHATLNLIFHKSDVVGIDDNSAALDSRKNSNVVRLLILVGNSFCGTRPVP